jgi:hypothetical protein
MQYFRNNQLGIFQIQYGEENIFHKRELIVLVGPPCIGKTTYISNHFDLSEHLVINRDLIVDGVSAENNFTYNDMFAYPPADSAGDFIHPKYGKLIPAPEQMKWCKFVYEKVMKANQDVNMRMRDTFVNAIEETNKNIILDMTNINSFTRIDALKFVKGKNFFKRAIVFEMSNTDYPELLNRMKRKCSESEDSDLSKILNENVLIGMISNFQPVSSQEGFDRIEAINNFKSDK